MIKIESKWFQGPYYKHDVHDVFGQKMAEGKPGFTQNGNRMGAIISLIPEMLLCLKQADDLLKFEELCDVCTQPVRTSIQSLFAKLKVHAEIDFDLLLNNFQEIEKEKQEIEKEKQQIEKEKQK